MVDNEQKTERYEHETDDDRTFSQPQKTGAVKPDPVMPVRLKEVGGPKGLEPTRFGDWERKGRCIDF